MFLFNCLSCNCLYAIVLICCILCWWIFWWVSVYYVGLGYAVGGYRYLNGSLPDLGGPGTDWGDSGESTDSLVDEAESYLRNSIDCIITGREITSHASRSATRRSSAPCPTRGNTIIFFSVIIFPFNIFMTTFDYCSVEQCNI